MKSYSNNDRAALAVGLKSLRSCNRYLGGALKKSQLEDNVELNDYLLRPFGKDTARDKHFEKAIATSIIKSRSKLTPAWVAKRQADGVIESLRNARIDTLYENGLSAKEYNRLKKDNYVANTITVVKRVKGFAKRRGVKLAVTALLGAAAPPVAIAMAGGFIVWEILPTRHKKMLKEKAAKLVDNAKKVVVKAVTALKEKGAKVVATVGEALATATEKVVEKGQQVCQAAKSTIKAAVEVVKETGARIKEGAKRVWNKITSWL